MGPAAAARTATRALVAALLLACALPGTASAAVARLRPGTAPGPTVEARALAEIGYAVVPDGTPGSVPDRGARTALTPNDPLYQYGGFQWVYAHTGFLDAWSTSTGSPSVVIAIVDTGVDPRVADLQGALLPGWNMIDNNADTSDLNGHGTAMAGLAAARTNNGIGVVGACGSCSILPVRVTAGSDRTASWSATAAGIVWAADRGARVISVSLAGTTSSPALDSAVSYAQGKGALVVAAAGNDSLDHPEYPAALPGVVSVEATDSNDNPYSFSNHGPGVSLAAPGCANTVGPADAYMLMCGTSVSTPIVAGAAGLFLSSQPSATATDLATALENGADHTSDSKYGRLNIMGAFRAYAPAAPKSVPPLLLSPPVVSGTPALGATLTATQGTWSQSGLSYVYQWLRCTNEGCTSIAGATAPSYRVVSADLGRWLEASVTASNEAGQVVSRSVGTPVPGAPGRKRPKKRG